MSLAEIPGCSCRSCVTAVPVPFHWKADTYSHHKRRPARVSAEEGYNAFRYGPSWRTVLGMVEIDFAQVGQRPRWSYQELERVRIALRAEKCLRAVAKELGRTHKAVKSKAQRLRLKEGW